MRRKIAARGDSAVLGRCARLLRRDLEVLRPAHAFASAVTARFLRERAAAPGDDLHHDVSVLYAAWVHFRFGLDEAEYLAFLERVLRERDPRSPLGSYLFTQMEGRSWGWRPPEDESGAAAIRLVDRIDLALNYLRRALRVELPEDLRTSPAGAAPVRYGIQGGHSDEERRALLVRASQLAQAAAELFVLED